LKIVNNSNFPKAIYDFLCQDFYDHEEVGDSISATTLLKPIQEIVLIRRHKEKIEIDVKDRVWSLFGSGVHAVLEKLRGETVEPIERMKVEINGHIVSGKYDLVMENKLTDYKVTSAWTIVYGSRVEEWKNQLSIYRWLYHKTYWKTLDDKASIIAIIRDWSDKDTWITNYPQSPIIEIDIELASLDKTEEAIKRKVDKIKKALEVTDENLPKCSDKDRWFNAKKQTYVKCEKYCIAKNYCHQVKNEK